MPDVMASAYDSISKVLSDGLKYYNDLKKSIGSADSHTLASMNDSQWSTEIWYINQLAGISARVLSYIDKGRPPLNDNSARGDADYKTERRRCVEVLLAQFGMGASPEEVLADRRLKDQLAQQAKALFDDARRLREEASRQRTGHFTTRDNATPEQIEEASNYLKTYVKLSNRKLQEYMNGLIASKSDYKRAEYDKMVESALIVNGVYDAQSKAKAANRFVLGEDVRRVAGNIVNYYNRVGNGSAAGYDSQRTEEAQEMELGIGAETGNSLMHLGPGATLESSGLSVRQAANIALSLNYAIWVAMQEMLRRSRGASQPAVIAAMNSGDVDGALEYLRGLPKDMEANRKRLEDVAAKREQLLVLGDIVLSMTNDQYNEFLKYYLNMDPEKRSPTSPVWENQAEYSACEAAVRQWMDVQARNKEAADMIATGPIWAGAMPSVGSGIAGALG